MGWKGGQHLLCVSLCAPLNYERHLGPGRGLGHLRTGCHTSTILACLPFPPPHTFLITDTLKIEGEIHITYN